MDGERPAVLSSLLLGLVQKGLATGHRHAIDSLSQLQGEAWLLAGQPGPHPHPGPLTQPPLTTRTSLLLRWYSASSLAW